MGKLHLTMGTKDTYYLDGAVRLLERFLQETQAPDKGPHYAGSVAYGEGEPHCWTGPLRTGETVELHYLPIFAEHMRRTAPAGADVQSWQ